MIPQPRQIAVAFLVIVLGLVGCSSESKTDGPAKGDAEGNSKGANASNAPKVTLSVQINKVEGNEELTQSLRMIPDPDAAAVEKEVKAIDWTNAQLRPSVALGRVVEGGVRNVRLEGRLGNANAGEELRAYWLGLLEGEAALRKTPPLESVEAGIDILLLFLKDDPKLQAMVVDWEKAE